MSGIAIAHSLFNILCTAMLLPAGGLLEKLAIRIVPDKGGKEQPVELEERLLITPSVALGRCRAVASEMAHCAGEALHMALTTLKIIRRSLRNPSVKTRAAATATKTSLVHTWCA